MKRKIVFVGMSGGVDSSVAAYLLKEQGYDVVGVFIKVWQPDFLHCPWEDERQDAMRVAAHLSIPFLTCDAEEAYRTHVGEYFIREYERGNTPNPDVMCNRAVKFGVFHQFAKEHGADFIATGHYARKEGSMLRAAKDTRKDQVYFLWNVPHGALEATLFPLGDLTKEEVRAIAKRASLPTAEKRDSQGVCFLGDIDIREFLGHYIKLADGDVLDQNGAVIGRHRGALLYTLGQRQGFTIHHAPDGHPRYVTARDVAKNTVTVDVVRPTLVEHTDISAAEVQSFRTVHVGDMFHMQTRYHGAKVPCTITAFDVTTVTVSPETTTDATESGQSLVLYDGDAVVLGGIMTQ